MKNQVNIFLKFRKLNFNSKFKTNNSKNPRQSPPPKRNNPQRKNCAKTAHPKSRPKNQKNNNCVYTPIDFCWFASTPLPSDPIQSRVIEKKSMQCKFKA